MLVVALLKPADPDRRVTEVLDPALEGALDLSPALFLFGHPLQEEVDVTVQAQSLAVGYQEIGLVFFK